jgi:hypothetical protein
MRSPLSGSLATCLIFVPLVAVPLLAILGMPQLSTNAPAAAGDDLKFAADDTAQAAGSADLLAPVRVSDSKTDPAVSLGEVRTVTAESDPFAEFGRDSDSARARKSSAVRNPASLRHQHWSNEGNGLPQKALLSTDRLNGDRAAADPAGDGLSAGRLPDDHAEPGSPAVQKMPGARRDLPEAQAVVALETESTATASSPEGNAASGATAALSSSDRSLTWKRAIGRLNNLGIRDYQLQAGEREGEFNFSCRLISRTNPRVIHRFEAEAADPLDAVSQVLRQIDEWKSRRGESRDPVRPSSSDAKIPSRAADSAEVELTRQF